MEFTKVYQWLKEEEHRRRILTAMKQPLTAKQVGRKTGIPMDTCSYILAKFSAKGLLTCLNPEARNSRLYWLTTLGRAYRKQLQQDLNLPYTEYDLPDVNWALYGWLCFSHRSAVIRTLSCPMQPSEIKRFLRIHRPNMKISANNIRDVIRLLLARKIVRPVRVRKKAHLLYELTDLGNRFRQLLTRAQAGF